MGTLYCILYFIWVFICLLTHFLCRHSFERVLRLESLVLWLEILYTPTDPYILNGLTDFLTNFKRDILCKASNKSVPIVYKTLLKNTNWIKDIPLTWHLKSKQRAIFSPLMHKMKKKLENSPIDVVTFLN